MAQFPRLIPRELKEARQLGGNGGAKMIQRVNQTEIEAKKPEAKDLRCSFPGSCRSWWHRVPLPL